MWNIVHGTCVPGQEQHGDPKPCAAVNLKDGVDKGYAVLKDRNGATQYLLIPTRRLIGIESPELLSPDAPNYFADAWDARRYVEKTLGHALPVDEVGLAINSRMARSQNQLHIHLDCILPNVRQTLAAQRAFIGATWSALHEPVGGHPYLAMRVSAPTLAGHNPFKLLTQGIPGASADMAQRTLVVVGMLFDDNEPGFVILAGRIDLLHGDFGAGARLLDHACAVGR